MSTISMNYVQLQRLYYQSNKLNSNWVPVLVLRALGYSSFVVTLISMIMYWYKKQQLSLKRYHVPVKQEPILVHNTNQDQSYINSKQEQIHFKTKPRPKQLQTSHLRRSSSTFSNLSLGSNKQLFTPPPSPHFSTSDFPISPKFSCPSTPRPSRPSTPTSSRSSVHRRPSTPLTNWSTRILDNVMSSPLVTNIMGRKKLTISLKNTVLWNPSSDVNTPNHAFHENAVFFIRKLTQLYDVYFLVQLNSKKERNQIQQLLNNSGLVDPTIIDQRKILYCQSEEGKIHLVQHIQPAVHIEGGWEKESGSTVINQLGSIGRIIWVNPSYTQPNTEDERIEYTDNILRTSVATQIGF